MSETPAQWAARACPKATPEHWKTVNAMLKPGATGALGIAELLQWMVDTQAPEIPPMRLVEAMGAWAKTQ